MKRSTVLVRKRGFLDWEAKVMSPSGYSQGWGFGVTRRRAIRSALRDLNRREQPWEEVRSA